MPVCDGIFDKDSCPCCNGSGIQTLKDGLRVICPCCKGTGIYKKVNIRKPINPYFLE